MSKGLEALKLLKILAKICSSKDIKDNIDENAFIIENELKEGEENKKYKQALEIIKEKQVDVRMFILYDLENYNKLQKNDYCKLTKAEDDLLRKVLL